MTTFIVNLKDITSQRLFFEHYSESDFDNYFRLVNDEEVMKMILGRPLLEEEAHAHFKNMQEVIKQIPK